MGPDRDENNDGTDDLRYPSPSAEASVSGPFYHTNPQDGGLEHDPQEPQDHSKEQGLGHDQADMHQTDPSTPQQQHVPRPPNLEELQLAAQLGHGLAGTPMMPATDPNMSVDDPNLRSLMPHPDSEPQQNTAYMQDPPHAESMVPHGLPVNVTGALQHYGLNDNIPPRKRSKVSRACDECRRKKIKCDAPSDTGETPCSSCARSSIRCLFSRVPQKRGPSKGYGYLVQFC
jgi:hypothetical protein